MTLHGPHQTAENTTTTAVVVVVVVSRLLFSVCRSSDSSAAVTVGTRGFTAVFLAKGKTDVSQLAVVVVVVSVATTLVRCICPLRVLLGAAASALYAARRPTGHKFLSNVTHMGEIRCKKRWQAYTASLESK